MHRAEVDRTFDRNQVQDFAKWISHIVTVKLSAQNFKLIAL